jgi:hypothetical protein
MLGGEFDALEHPGLCLCLEDIDAILVGGYEYTDVELVRNTALNFLLTAVRPTFAHPLHLR